MLRIGPTALVEERQKCYLKGSNSPGDPRMTRWTSVKRVLPVLLATLLTACASIDFDYPKEASSALVPADTADTHLGRQVSPVVAEFEPGESAFYPIADGIDALAARLLLAARAEQTIDVQYYLIKNDVVGRVFIDALLQAADRGVRVRLLLDDIFTKGYDAGMAALDSHPNFEIRIYNPFGRSGGRAINSVTSFSRINRRMHNKSFTVDSQVTLIGGRNIADEYFGAREDAKFGDLDVVGFGPVVDDVSDMFDSYWNHETALPVPAFAKMPDDPEEYLIGLRERLATARQEASTSEYAEAVRTSVLAYMEDDAADFRIAPYTLVFDSPDKGIKSRAAEADSITSGLIESLQSAENRIVVISPYFVPMKSGIAAFSEAQASGVDITIITNSLAANNQFTVHGGYAPSRKPLLRNGIKIYEVRPDADVAGAQIVAASGAKATLHTKAFIVDDRELFIGSFNFDPRSANINTELGVVIRSPELAQGYLKRIDEVLPTQTYEVFLNEDGKLRWRTIKNGEEVILSKEPETTWGQRFMAGLMRFLMPRSQL
jgi:putative cardiolipin synthase